MTDAELLGALNSLGLDEQSYRCLVLLPVVQVAWADGKVSGGERVRILRAVDEEFHLNPLARTALDGWLQHRPSEAYFSKGIYALGVLAMRIKGMSLIDDNVNRWKTLATEVAKADGGILGLWGISPEEKAAIARMEAQLDAHWGGDGEGSLASTLGDVLAAQLLASPTFVRARLTYTNDEGKPVVHAVDETGFAVGRHGENDLAIRIDGMVSRRHCRIFEKDKAYWLEDHDSQHGTLVNGERVRERRLFDGDVITIGSYELHFSAEA